MRKEKYIIESELLWALYWGEDLPITKIAKLFNCCHASIWAKINKYGIPIKDKSISHIGQIAWNKGKIGVMPIPWNKDKHLSEYTKRNISNTLIKKYKNGYTIWNKGIPCSKETKEKISKSNSGKEGFWKGKTKSKEITEKQSKTMKEKGIKPCDSPNWYHLSGDLHPMKVIIEKELLEQLYYGNNYSKSKIAEIFDCSLQTILPKMKGYGIENKELISKDKSKRMWCKWELRKWRKQIFENDKYTCQICNRIDDRLNAHHIKSWKDYPEERFSLDNGITLCVDCHKSIHSLKPLLFFSILLMKSNY